MHSYNIIWHYSVLRSLGLTILFWKEFGFIFVNIFICIYILYVWLIKSCVLPNDKGMYFFLLHVTLFFEDRLLKGVTNLVKKCTLFWCGYGRWKMQRFMSPFSFSLLFTAFRLPLRCYLFFGYPTSRWKSIHASCMLKTCVYLQKSAKQYYSEGFCQDFWKMLEENYGFCLQKL